MTLPLPLTLGVNKPLGVRLLMVAVGRSNPTGGDFLVNLFFLNVFCLADLSDFLSDILIVKNPIDIITLAGV